MPATSPPKRLSISSIATPQSSTTSCKQTGRSLCRAATVLEHEAGDLKQVAGVGRTRPLSTLAGVGRQRKRRRIHQPFARRSCPRILPDKRKRV